MSVRVKSTIKSFSSSCTQKSHSVLWCCWLGSRKNTWVVRCWHGYLSGARCTLAYGRADATATHCLLLQQNPDWLLPFWYRLTRVVLDKGPLKGCVCVFLYTEQCSTRMGITSMLWRRYMSKLVHKRWNSSDTENSLATHRTTYTTV